MGVGTQHGLRVLDVCAIFSNTTLGEVRTDLQESFFL